MSLNPCQPGSATSCAACCGVYSTGAREAIAARLQMRFDRLLGKPAEAFRAAALALSALRRSSEAPGGSVAHCALAGFLDREGRRVGCVGHPIVTGGPDYRDQGSFGSHTCETFQCPSVGVATDDEIALVRDGCDDWFLYGLVITDVVFVRRCLEAVRAAANVRLAPPDLAKPEIQAALHELFALKNGCAPFGDGPAPGQDLAPLALGVAKAMALR